VGRVSAADLYPFSAVVLWSGTIVTMKYAVSEGFSPPAVAGMRFGAAALILGGIVLVRRDTLRFGSRRTLLVMLGAGTIYAWNQLAFVYALHHATATVVALMMGLSPMAVAIVAALFGLEPIRRRVMLAALVSFAGVGLVVLGSRSGAGVDLLGFVLCLLLPISWALYSALLTRPSREHSPLPMGAFVTIVATLLVAPVATPAAVHQGLHFGWLVWACVAFAALGGIVAATLLWFKALDRVGPGRAMLFMNVQPFLAVLLAWGFLSEPITALEVIGGATIIVGILLARGRTPGTASQPVAVPAPE
jgi:drug/metabolite transporter (DMT)-like permease